MNFLELYAIIMFPFLTFCGFAWIVETVWERWENR